MRSALVFLVVGTAFGCTTGEAGDEQVMSLGGAEEAPTFEESSSSLVVRSFQGMEPVITDIVGYDPMECGIAGSLHPERACREDEDGDTVVAAFDCDDRDASRSPNREDRRCDGVDQNCISYDDCDRDNDGVQAVFDRDDLDSSVGVTP